MKPIHRRNTFQRQLIMEIICNVDNHPTADEIYQQILLRYSNISKATVYRNLNLLAEMGMIKKIECPGQPDRYDRSVKPHYHAQCLRCGRFIDVLMPYNKIMDMEASKASGFDIEKHEIIFEGICPNCRKEQ